MKKSLIITIIIVCTMVFATVCSYAGVFDDIMNGATGFLTQPSGIEESSLAEMIRDLTNIGLVIGTIVAIVVGIIVAMRLMMGGAEGRADLKSALTPYVIGVAILFGAYGIWAIIINLFVAAFK